MAKPKKNKDRERRAGKTKLRDVIKQSVEPPPKAITPPEKFSNKKK
jgi:hypothetical protein